ncbi:MAG: DUF1887 family protein [Clostridia bacterium]|nr:DUF1887 family protein [Clostridia bacterium]
MTEPHIKETAASLPDTIIELYDDEQIYNVLAITELRPKRVIYLGPRRIKKRGIKNSIINSLRILGLDTQCFFYTADMMSLESIKSKLDSLIDTFGECTIDLTGGSEVALVAVGMLAASRKIPLMRYDRSTCRYKDIYCCPVMEGRVSDPHLSVPSVLALAGGVMKEHGHLAIDGLTDESAADILTVWGIFKRFHRTWHRAVSYLQQVNKQFGGESLSVKAPSVIFSGERIVNCDSAIMNALSEAGILENYENDASGVRFSYKSALMRSCLLDTGICLELYVYATARQSGLYDDVQISVVVDWDGDLEARINTLNEIDVMLTRGMVPVFISCKSGSPNVVALNEIKTLAKQFGGVYGRPVLVTMSDVRNRDAYLYQRASDMDVTIIDYTDLVNDRLSKRLAAVSKV